MIDRATHIAECRAAWTAHRALSSCRSAGSSCAFFDIGSVVYILRKCVWWVPDFTVERYLEKLRTLDALIRSNGSFLAHSSRYLIEARR
jgi:hypothetical protein